MRSFLTLFLFLTLSFVGSSAEVKDVIEKMQLNYASNKTFSMNAKYILYKKHDSGNVFQEYSGFIGNGPEGMYQKIDQTELISTKEFSIQVSHSDQKVYYALPKKHEAIADVSTAIKKASSSTIVEKNGVYIIEFSFENKLNIDLSHVRLKIDVKTFLLKSIDIYYSTQTDFSKDFFTTDYAQSHLRIEYSNYKKQNTTEKAKYALSTYVSKNKSNIISLVGNYKDYELIDIRVN
jgi:hypothetical protein